MRFLSALYWSSSSVPQRLPFSKHGAQNRKIFGYDDNNIKKNNNTNNHDNDNNDNNNGNNTKNVINNIINDKNN